jgi:hypothetical protein
MIGCKADPTIFSPEQTELSRLLVELELSMAGHYKDWIFYLWIIQVKLKRGKPTPVVKHFNKLNLLKNDPKFRIAYNAFCEVWDYGVENFDNFDLWTAGMHKEMEWRYQE